MGTMRTVGAIARADLLERTRRFSFLVVLGSTMMAAYFFVPPPDAGYVTLHLGGNYTGIYNSAWIGGSVAISTVLFLSLFGFYLVNTSIERDERTGFSEIIASTNLGKASYLVGKWLSNFIVLTLIIGAVALVAAIMQWSRGEVRQVEIVDLLSPFVIVALPAMAVVAAAAVLFETRPYLRGLPGNILYFVIYLAYTMTASMMPVGISVLTSDMVRQLSAHVPEFSGTYGVGILVPDEPIERFDYQGVNWTLPLIARQWSLIATAMAILLLAALLFRRFAEPKRKSGGESSVWMEDRSDERAFDTTASLCGADLTPMSGRRSFLPLIAAEWRLMMKEAGAGWYAVAALLSLLCLFMPASLAFRWMVWPFVWIWAIKLWSGMGSRETRFRTEYLVFASPRPAFRQLSAVWLAGIMLALLVSAGMLIRLAIEKDVAHLAYALSAVILIPSLSLACGVWTRTNRTFEVLFMMVWYLGPFNQVPVIDFLGSSAGDARRAIWLSALYALAGILLTALAYYRRSAN